MESVSETTSKKDESMSLSTVKGIITITLFLGLIAGGASGAIVAALISGDGLPLGRDHDLSLNRSRTLIVEESSIVDTVDTASQSVVSIIVEKEASQATGNVFGNPFFNFQIPGFEFVPPEQENEVDGDVQPQEEFVQVGAGTGFIVSDDGLILTNKHVVNDEDARYSIITKDGDTHEVEILGIDPINDLALLKTVNTVDLPPALQLGDSDSIQIGQTVIAIGNSLGEFSNTVTKGVVSGINRRVAAGGNDGFSEILEAVIQTDAAINPGNSGGPLLNGAGQVIGINTAVSQQGQLIGFAIPINDAIRFIEDIEEHGRVIRPYLGVRYVLVNPQLQKANNLDVDHGALLRRGDNPNELAVIPGGPADKAGLEENDIIIEVNGQRIDETHSLVRVLSDYEPGETVELTVLKDGQEVKISLTLGEFENQE